MSLAERYSRLVASRSRTRRGSNVPIELPPKNHEMVIALYESEVIGFVEVGISPIPTARKVDIASGTPETLRISNELTSTLTSALTSTLTSTLTSNPSYIEEKNKKEKNNESDDNSHTLWSINENASDIIYIPQIGNLVVSERFRRQGVASALMTVGKCTIRNEPYIYCTYTVR